MITLRLACVSIALTLMSFTVNSVSAQEAPRPNILLVVTDNQSWLHTGFGGTEALNTPAFDRIAREGVYFTHAFAPSPSCTPARSAMLTGQDIWRLE